MARQGQKHTVFVHHLIADGTIDEDVVKALTAKKDAQDLLFYLLKKIRRRMNQQSKTKQECQISLIDNDPPYTLT
jgi:SNF2 family DNA or RNA helicase